MSSWFSIHFFPIENEIFYWTTSDISMCVTPSGEHWHCLHMSTCISALSLFDGLCLTNCSLVSSFSKDYKFNVNVLKTASVLMLWRWEWFIHNLVNILVVLKTEIMYECIPLSWSRWQLECGTFVPLPVWLNVPLIFLRFDQRSMRHLVLKIWLMHILR